MEVCTIEKYSKLIFLLLFFSTEHNSDFTTSGNVSQVV